VVARLAVMEGRLRATLDADVRRQEAEVVDRLPLHADKGLDRVRRTEKTVDDVAEADHHHPRLANRLPFISPFDFALDRTHSSINIVTLLSAPCVSLILGLSKTFFP